MQLVAERLQNLLEVLAALQAAAAGDHAARAIELWLVALLLGVADPLDASAGVGLRGDRLHGRGRGTRRGGLEGRRPEGQNLHGVIALHGGDGVARIHRPAEGALLGAHGDDVRNGLHIELSGHAREDLLREGVADGGDDAVGRLRLQGEEELRSGVRHWVLQLGGLGDEDLANALHLADFLGHGAATFAKDQDIEAGGAGELGGRGDDLQGALAHGLVVMLGNQQGAIVPAGRGNGPRGGAHARDEAAQGRHAWRARRASQGRGALG
mmetsp:Transcript_25411/g.50866  ORF Transcript_25411/g.50866 Transcript_25411/m.50866 type:complete len:268 (-) Transcript_25411:8-811(-)